jgi:hypothetical protein
MSNFVVKNNTNSKTNTLTNTLITGATTIPGYRQADADITGSVLLIPAVEAATTGYRSGGVDIGNSYCVKYVDYTSSGTLNVANYSSCTIVMCGGGGGGGGGSRSVNATPIIRTGGAGGVAGFSFLQRIPLTGITSIPITVGTGGPGGAGQPRGGSPSSVQEGTAGNASIVVIGSTSYTANSGTGGFSSTVNPALNGTAGSQTPTSPDPYTTSTTFNGPFVYVKIQNLRAGRTITIGGINYGTGGTSGIGTPTGNANGGSAGGTGGNGFVRIYLYP